MLKRYIIFSMLSLVCSSVYADGHSTLDIADNVKNQSFHLNVINYTYQFNNNADDKSKPMQFSLTVDPGSLAGVHIECFKPMQPVEEFDILPGKTGGCLTSDAVRVVQLKDGDVAVGNYSITLNQ